MNALALSFYRYVIMPIAVTLLPALSLFNRKLRAGFRLRRERWQDFPAGERPLWIHAASGEFEYAKALIRELKAEQPDLPIAVTYFSPTFAKAARNFPGVDRAIALPLDLPGPCRSFLKRLNPRQGLIARTDLWPELLTQCRALGVPVDVFSYTQKDVRSPFKRWHLRWVLGLVRRIYCVTAEDRENLSRLGFQSEVLGDTRYDQVAYRLLHPKAIAAALHPDGRAPCFVAGSTWAEDEAVLIPALAQPLREGRLKLILVPHEPTAEHLAATERALTTAGLTFARFSANEAWNDKMVLLVDKVGTLAELYLWADFALVGGSYRKTVHSVMEALGAGCLTFVGPKHLNNREALQFKELQFGKFRGVEVAADSAALGTRVEAALQDPEGIDAFRAELLKEFKNRLGASRRLAAQLRS